MGYNQAINQMKKRLTQTFIAIVMITMMASCTKEETPTIYKPIDHISVPRAEYIIYNGTVTKARYSISNQSNKTLYYCKFRVTQCSEEGIEYYSKVYETGDKNDMTLWVLPAGDINFTGYYDVNFLHEDNGHIKSEIIDAKFY